MAKTKLQELAELGQSPWLDNIRRRLITSGGMQDLIDKGIVGVTANPTIFEKAISGSTDYDSAIEELVKEGKSPADIYKILIIEDISSAADVFRPGVRPHQWPGRLYLHRGGPEPGARHRGHHRGSC